MCEKFRVTNFYTGDVKEFSEMAMKLKQLSDEGYKPYIQLSISDNYSVWSFIKDDNNQ